MPQNNDSDSIEIAAGWSYDGSVATAGASALTCRRRRGSNSNSSNNNDCNRNNYTTTAATAATHGRCRDA